MASTTNIKLEHRDVFGHIEGLNGIRPTALGITKYWCLDNSVFTGKFELSKWLKLMERLKEWKDKCLFVAIPDVLVRLENGSVVGDALSTLKQFHSYRKMVRDFPVALVSQDGIRNHSNIIPWDDFDCLFVGGSNEHKLGDEGRWVIEESKKRGKWIHIGRVNSCKRLNIFWDVDSWDGTHLSFAPSESNRFYECILKIRERKSLENET
jgi:hypothetical protein